MYSTAKQDAKLMRLEEVVRMCKSKPTTLKNIESELGIVYNTAWRYVEELKRTGRIHPIAKLKDGNVAYVTGKQSDLPTIWNQHTNDDINLMDVMQVYDPKRVLGSETAAHNLQTYMVQLMRAISLEDLDAALKLRTEILTAASLLSSSALILNQLADPKFYDVEKHKLMRSDPEFNSALITAAYDRWLSSLQEEQEQANA